MEETTFRMLIVVSWALALLLIGFYAYRRGLPNPEDYFVAGRSLGFTIASLSLMATVLSAFAFLGLQGFAYWHGLGVVAIGSINLIYPMTYVFIGREFWELGKRYGYITPADLMRHRYGRMAGALTALIGLLCAYPLMVVQMAGVGIIFNALTEGAVPPIAGVIFLMALMAIYVALGGLRGAAWTNFIQGIMIVSLLALASYELLNRFGGMANIYSQISSKFPQLLSLPGPHGFWTHQQIISWAIIYGMGIIMTPTVWMSMYSMRSLKDLKRTSLAWILIMPFWHLFFLCTIGIVGRLTFPDLTERQADSILPLLAAKLMPHLCGPLLAGAVAAAVSTAQFLLIASSAIVTNDLLRPILRIPERRAVALGRAIVALLAISAIPLAISPPGLLVDLGSMAYSMAALLFVPTVAGLYWRRANGVGASAGLMAGVATLLWLYYGPRPYGGFGVWGAWLGFPAAFWSTAFCSLFIFFGALLGPRAPNGMGQPLGRGPASRS
ncbi:MAG: sodium:solute symporter family protein [Candidatus Bathyarchaeia archaeon]